MDAEGVLPVPGSWAINMRRKWTATMVAVVCCCRRRREAKPLREAHGEDGTDDDDTEKALVGDLLWLSLVAAVVSCING
jgi:hypothetical protein